MRFSPPPPSFPRRAALFLAALCASLAVFFRGQIGDGFTLLLGDRHDGVIALAIMEHWVNVFAGHAAWDQTFYFHPVPATLGYNDGYLGFGIPYALFRAMGADPFLSGELTNLTLRAVGFAGFHWMMRRVFGVSFVWALLGAVLFTLANNLAIRGSHVQLFSVGLVPVLAVLAHGAGAALLAQRRAALLGWGMATVLWLALMLLTGFYMAWYSVFFAMVLLPAWVALAGAEGRGALLAGLRRGWPALGALGALAVVANLPFLKLYLPKARETGMHDYAGMVAQYTLSPLDLIHVGERNWLWGWLVRALNDVFRPDMPFWSEQMTGFPVLLLAVFLLALVWLPRGARGEPGVALWRAVAVATLVTWVLTMRFGEASPWWWVYQGVPGAGAARVVARYQIFLAVPVTALAVLALAVLAARAGRFARVAVAALSLLLVAEQLNAYAPRFLDRPLEAGRLASVPPPPAECRAFFVTAGRTQSRFGEAVDDIYNHNTEAMLVAEVLRLPTIGGISTFNPPHWPGGFPPQPAYFEAVRRYAQEWGVAEGLCGLDLRGFTWSVAPLR